MLFIHVSLRPMEKLSLSYRRQLTRTGLACAIGVCMPHLSPSLIAQEPTTQPQSDQPGTDANKAYKLLQTGDTAYEAQDYKTAVNDYSQAFALMPNTPETEELRVIASVRYATAATEHSRKLAKNGDYDAARILLDKVLQPEISPTHLGALKLRQQIEDPIRYNHALTPEHVKDASEVGQNLRRAEGHLNLGQYDKANALYQKVLQTDPFNRAARRGMERVSTIKSDYYRSAQDHTRAELLSQVDKEWELYTPPADGTVGAIPLTSGESLAPDVRDRLAGITIPVVDFDSISLSEAVDFIRVQSRLGDAPGPGGEKTGINIILNVGSGANEVTDRINNARINLKLRNVPLAKVLDYVTEQTHTQWRTDGVGILINPLGSVDEILTSQTFSVPPNFLSSASGTQETEGGNIFDNPDDQSGGLLPTKVSITDFLKQNGITFPEGASASYSPATNKLTVRNTSENIDIISQLVDLASNAEPVQVLVRTTIMRVSEEHVKELGFDWAITPLGPGVDVIGEMLDFGDLDGGGVLSGGSTGNGSILEGFSDAIGLAPITSGNRSGDEILPGDPIDSVIAAENTGVRAAANRAPGILKLSYVGAGAQVEVLMRGLDQKTGADIMTSPSTVMRSGERSKIEIIREFIYPTEYEPPEIADVGDDDVEEDEDDDGGGDFTVIGPGVIPIVPITPSHPTAFETRSVGVTLEVEPTVGPHKRIITLSLNPELVEFDGFINYGTPIGGTLSGATNDNLILMPVFSKIATPNISLDIQDGHTVVLGGVMTSSKTQVEDKTPILGDIPYAGRLFQTKAERTFNEAIIISVTAEIIDPTGKPWRHR